MSKYLQYLRSGSQKGSTLEQIHQNLNKGRGSAYASFQEADGTVVDVLNYAKAKAINEIWNQNERLANQWDPNKISVYLSRWEKIFGIYPNPEESDNDRRDVIRQKMLMWSQPPNASGVRDLAVNILGNLLLAIEKVDATTNPGSIEGGGNIPGGASLSNASWFAPVSAVIFYLWRPKDKNFNYLITEKSFLNKSNRLIKMLDDYLPSWVESRYYRYPDEITNITDGTVSLPIGSTTLTGIGTTFSQLGVGQKMEVIGEDGLPKKLEIASIINDQTLTVTTSLTVEILNSKYSLLLFILDTVNLNTLILEN